MSASLSPLFTHFLSLISFSELHKRSLWYIYIYILVCDEEDEKTGEAYLVPLISTIRQFVSDFFLLLLNCLYIFVSWLFDDSLWLIVLSYIMNSSSCLSSFKWNKSIHLIVNDENFEHSIRKRNIHNVITNTAATVDKDRTLFRHSRSYRRLNNK